MSDHGCPVVTCTRRNPAHHDLAERPGWCQPL